MSTDIDLLKREVRDIKKTLEEHGMRIEDLERAGSPDGVVDARASDESSQISDNVARVCQHVRQSHGDTKTDLVGGA